VIGGLPAVTLARRLGRALFRAIALLAARDSGSRDGKHSADAIQHGDLLGRGLGALHPIVGVIEFPGYQRATVADIPGLIEGAHRGLGLGHEFLRHITRCRVLVFVVDTAGSEGRNPVEDLQNLRREIDLYDPTLSPRAWFVVANKMDLPGAKENLKALRERFPKLQILPTSAAKGEGIEDLKHALATRTAQPEESVSAAI